MSNNNEEVSVLDFAKELKSNAIDNIRLLETNNSRIFDNMITIIEQLVQQNLSLSQELKDKDDEINLLKEKPNEG